MNLRILLLLLTSLLVGCGVIPEIDLKKGGASDATTDSTQHGASATELIQASGGLSAYIDGFSLNHSMIIGHVTDSTLFNKTLVVAMNQDGAVFETRVQEDGTFRLAVTEGKVYSISFFGNNGANYLGTLSAQYPDGSVNNLFLINSTEQAKIKAAMKYQAAEATAEAEVSASAKSEIDLGEVNISESGSIETSGNIAAQIDSDSDGDVDAIDDDTDGDGVANEIDGSLDIAAAASVEGEAESGDGEAFEAGMELLLDAEIKHRCGRPAPLRFHIKSIRNGELTFFFNRDIAEATVAVELKDAEGAKVAVNTTVSENILEISGKDAPLKAGLYTIKITVNGHVLRHAVLVLFSDEQLLEIKLRAWYKLKLGKVLTAGELRREVSVRLANSIVVKPNFHENLHIEKFRRFAAKGTFHVRFFQDVSVDQLPAHFITLTGGASADESYDVSYKMEGDRLVSFSLSETTMAKIEQDLAAAKGRLDLKLTIKNVGKIKGASGTLVLTSHDHRLQVRLEHRTDMLLGKFVFQVIRAEFGAEGKQKLAELSAEEKANIETAIIAELKDNGITATNVDVDAALSFVAKGSVKSVTGSEDGGDDDDDEHTLGRSLGRAILGAK